MKTTNDSAEELLKPQRSLWEAVDEPMSVGDYIASAFLAAAACGVYWFYSVALFGAS